MGRGLMRMLMRAHNALYSIISSYSVRIEGGVHPKHRLMEYWRFFASNIKNNQRILDIGCGYGQLARKIAQERKAEITGIDIDPANIAKAKRINEHPRVTYLVGDATKHRFTEEFDTIVLSNVLEHIEKRVVFLKRIKRLAPTILIRVPMVDRDWLTLYKKEVGADYRLDPTHYTEFTEETFRKEIAQAGLRVESLSVRFGEIYAVVRR